ncbi:MFS transporter [Maritalea sp.]|uniref:MFS transporter n=1 Tax=Maritalea sp. TaxID=2003361 RepID=UPI003EF652F6
MATFASRFVLFMVWPFLAILLHQKFGLNEFQIGAFLSGSATVGVVFGFYVGFLSDKIGRRKIILVGLALNIVAMIVLGTSNDLWWLFAGTLVQSFGRGMVENPSKALMTDMVENRAVKDMALHVRYFALNVGAATGPLLGIFAGATGEQSTFFFVAGVYVIYLTAGALIFRLERPIKKTKAGDPLRFGDAVSVLRKDTAFLIFVAATLIADIAYGQIDAGLIQYLRQEDVMQLAQFYATLIFINGTTIVLLQFALLKLLENMRPLNRATLGVVLFAAGFLGFAIVPTHPTYWIMGAMFVLSVGEAILFPTLNIIIDRMAPDHLKGSYFGAASLASLGIVMAPIVGGFLLHQFGGFTMWMVMTTLAVSVAVFYRLAANMRKELLN